MNYGWDDVSVVNYGWNEVSFVSYVPLTKVTTIMVLCSFERIKYYPFLLFVSSVYKIHLQSSLKFSEEWNYVSGLQLYNRIPQSLRKSKSNLVPS